MLFLFFNALRIGELVENSNFVQSIMIFFLGVTILILNFGDYTLFDL